MDRVIHSSLRTSLHSQAAARRPRRERRKVAQNWPPLSVLYPPWPPAELDTTWLSFSDIQSGLDFFLDHGFVLANPTAQENQTFFRQVRCDQGDPCSGIILVSPLGLRYPIAYCTGANHKSALVLWDVSGGTVPGGSYDLGFGSGNVP